MNFASKNAIVSGNFGKALRRARKAKNVPQEEFDLVSSRTYISTLERGLKQPTLPKIEALASVLQIHPLTLVALAYIDRPVKVQLLDVVKNEIAILLKAYEQST